MSFKRHTGGVNVRIPNENPLDYPFLDYKGVIKVLGYVCGKDKAYQLMRGLLKERDANGELLVDPKKIPDIGKIIVPTEVFCKRYGIRRLRKKEPISKSVEG